MWRDSPLISHTYFKSGFSLDPVKNNKTRPTIRTQRWAAGGGDSGGGGGDSVDGGSGILSPGAILCS